MKNGIKFNESSNPTIIIEYERGNDMHEFLAQENEVGITLELYKKIFGMSKRLHDRKAYQIFGFGLNNVKKIIEKLGGSIDIVESDLNTDSLFQVCLPDLSPLKV